MWNRTLNRDEDRADVDRELSVELVETEGLDIAEDGNPGVVDEHVEPAELGYRIVDRLRHLLGVGAVGLDRHGRSAVGRHFGDQLLGLSRGPAVCEGDGGAVGGEASDDFGTDAAGRAGDQRTATLEVCHSAFKLTHGG